MWTNGWVDYTEKYKQVNLGNKHEGHVWLNADVSGL